MKKWMGMAVVLAAAALTIGGCGKPQYEYIAAEDAGEMPESRKQEPPEIVLEEASTEADVIVLEADGVEGEKAEETKADGSISLLFGGDVLLSDHVLNAYQRSGGIGGVVDGGYRQAIEEADFFMVNQEFPFSSRGTAAADKQYTFRLPPEKVPMFRELGIDAVTLANNHALDFGTEALLDTCATLDGAGILHTGAGENLEKARKPVVAELEGTRIGILGTTRVIPEAGWAAGKNHAGMLATYDATATLETIRQMRAECDYVIVFVHWGIERDEKPQEYQRTLGQQYIDAGADLVIGSHPHVLQGIEYYKGRPIVYSLGNFVFGSSIPRTALLRVELPIKPPVNPPEGQPADVSADVSANRAADLRLLPGTSGAGYTRMLTEAGDVQVFYQYMESISSGISIDAQGKVTPGA